MPNDSKELARAAMDASAFLQYLTTLSGYSDQIVHVEHIPPRKAIAGKLDRALPDSLNERLSERDFLPLYRHQAEAINPVSYTHLTLPTILLV